MNRQTFIQPFTPSAAPVLELLPERETVAHFLAEETEVLFAQAKAQQRLSSQELLDRLAKAEPEDVYLAVLQSLLPEDEDTEVPHHYHSDFINMLSREQSWYQKAGRWPGFPRDLAMLIDAVGEG